MAEVLLGASNLVVVCCWWICYARCCGCLSPVLPFPSVSRAAMDKVLGAIRGIESLPESFRESVPQTYRALLTALKDQFKVDMGMEFVYDVCPVCRTLYCCNWKDSKTCGVCNAERYDKDGKSLCGKFVYRCFSETIRRIFSNKTLAKLAVYHKYNRASYGDICDFQDGEAYAKAMEDPEFQKDPRHLLVGLATDGVQPFGDDKKYSIWPILATSFNFPPRVRYLLGVTTLLGVIPGRKTKEPKLFKFKLHSYLKVFIDELAFLSATGVKVYDAYREQHFRCRAKLMQVKYCFGLL